VGSKELPQLTGRSHIVFFWATWCAPCKAAVPEVMAFAQARGLPVLAITDEEPNRVFLKAGWGFFHDAVDPLRRNLHFYGGSGADHSR
jgi:thiol-disulfide isomerase/thioredoxin